MNETTKITADVRTTKKFSAVWIIPLISLTVGIWMLYQYVSNQGTEITLTVQTAEGIEAGKTEIKARSVKVGVVTKVSLSEDYNSIILKAKIDKSAAGLLRKDTLFWVVKPRIGKDGVSGLDTLLSGAYIELRPGKAKEEQDSYAMLEVPPVAPPDAKGLRVLLTSSEAGKLSVGDPVLYEGYTVGRVEKVSFDISKRKAVYQLFVFQPYDALVRTRSRFWMTSGVDLQLNAQGFNVDIGSLESLLTGGVSFTVPSGSPQGTPVTQQMASFKLFDTMKQVREQMYENYLEYAMLFSESVRGLNPGAPVEYRGIRIGTVEKVPLHLSNRVNGFSSDSIPVLVHIETDRFFDPSLTMKPKELQENFAREFKKGLRATLKTGNLLTGALYIDTDFYPDERKQDYVTDYRGYDVFPTKAGGFAQIQRQVSSILNKVNSLPVENMLASMDGTLKSTEQTLKTFNQVGRNLDKLLKQKDTQQIPGEVRESLQQIQDTLQGFSPDAQAYRDLEKALANMNDVMAELKPVLRQINEKPNALIFGDTKREDPVPAKGKN
ncbi:intermembrane transport protein PqiB [Parasalinivibrio latis]|uniref:intermembrane transport protein PqiB n=1 Tax=Parasalinivibrio latis TaxID=2952610 RepID=UPI0030DF0410